MSLTDPPLTAAFDRRWVLRIVVLTVAVFVAVGLATVVLRPDRVDGPGPGFARELVAACTRSGVDEERCRCAADAWQAEVPPGEQLALDDALSDGAEPPAALRGALARC